MGILCRIIVVGLIWIKGMDSFTRVVGAFFNSLWMNKFHKRVFIIGRIELFFKSIL
jgi:hypothetical protein